MSAPNYDIQARLNEVYAERNQAAMLAAAIAWDYGFPVGLRVDPDEPDWPVLYIELPSGIGQVSWHLTKVEAEQIAGCPEYDKPWDEHTSAEKRERITDFVSGWFAGVMPLLPEPEDR